MSKLVRKMLLDEMIDIKRHEGYLAYMSAKGYHIKKYGKVFVYFEEGEPKNLQYRVILSSQTPTPEQSEDLLSNGWSFVAKSGYFYIYCAPEGAGVTDPPTITSAEGNHALKRIEKGMLTGIILMGVSLVFYFGMIASIYIFNPEPILIFIENGPQMLIVSVMEIFLTYTILRNYKQVRKLKNAIQNGVHLKPITYTGVSIPKAVSLLFFFFAAGMSLIIPIKSASEMKIYTLPETVTFPYVYLREFEQNPKLEKVEHFNSGVDYANSVRYSWGLVAKKYEVHEEGVVKGEMWKDKSGVYSPSLFWDYYELATPLLTQPLIEALINRHIVRYNLDTVEAVEEVEAEGFERFYTYTSKNGLYKQIFVSSRNEVHRITYSGNTDLDEIIALIKNKI